jgi:hypothetical protein
MIDLSTIPEKEVKARLETLQKIEDLVTILDALDSKTQVKKFLNYDAMACVRKILGRKTSWDALGSRTQLKRRLKKLNFNP